MEGFLVARAEGVDWITALRAPAIGKLVADGHLQLSLFDERALAEITSPDYPGERLIVCRNPFLAQERTRKRRELVEATEKDLKEIVAATRRPKRRLKGREKIALRVGKVLGRYKVGKHFEIEITDDSFQYSRNAERIREEQALDGIYVIRTSLSKKVLEPEDVVRTYKSLSSVERAFRSLKSVDLKIRPIHHRRADRVKAHVLLCMLAYYVEWHMRRSLAQMLFDDDDKAGAEARRTSIVAPAKRSSKAEQKAHTKRTADGQPVHSFQTLLRDLATVTKNHTLVGGIAFDQITTPTPVQQRALDFLGVSLRLT